VAQRSSLSLRRCWTVRAFTGKARECYGRAAWLSLVAVDRPPRWTHMLGFRGHFVTKSRYCSTTLGELRGARAAWRADRDDAELEDDTTPVLSVWEYLGCGDLNPGDALLAAGVEASIRVAREARVLSAFRIVNSLQVVVYGRPTPIRRQRTTN
jgi:hypothetical protein